MTSGLTADDKVLLVLSVMSGRLSPAEAAARAQVSVETLENWLRLLCEGGQEGLGGTAAEHARMAMLQEEATALRNALAEAELELHIWQQMSQRAKQDVDRVPPRS